MREGRPSQTAALVAFARAAADVGLTRVPGFSDPVARHLLPTSWRIAFERFARRIDALDSRARARIMDQMDLIPLRVRAIDVELERAVAEGCRQVVILGAGLDTRAFRMPALGSARVFEVDHSATQSFKRRKAQSLTPVACALTYVTVDFERDSLGAELRAAGHRPEEPTAWVWEGVVMYLTDDALRATLRAIAEASATASALIVNYHEPDVRKRSRFFRLLLAAWSEPQIGLRRRETMAVEVERTGFRIVSDTGAADWARQLGTPLLTSRSADVARIVVARRSP